MTSTPPNFSRKEKSTLAAQDLIKLKETVFKNGLIRKKGKKLNIGKWPTRFVVLTYDSMYIYTNETSRTPNSKFCLIGYNQVVRCEFKGQSWCFSLVPASNIESIEIKTFACTTDEERKAWMKAIKNQLYAANNIPKPDPAEKSKMKSLINDDDDYASLETRVYDYTAGIVTHRGTEHDDDYDDDDDNSFGEVDASSFRKSLSNKIEFQKKKNDTAHQTEDTYDEVLVVTPSPKAPREPKKRQPTDPQPSLPSSDSAGRLQSDSLHPPRYSDVCEEDESTCDNSEYVNCTQTKVSLESMCTITDKNPDREQLIVLLQTKKEPGTYLIRRSRQSDQKVIAYLNEKGEVKEYKILGTSDNQTLGQKISFKCTEDLLRHYTSKEPLPNSTSYLKKGIHEFKK